MTQHFMRVGESGAEQPVLELNGTIYDLRPLTADVDGAFLEGDGLKAAAAAALAGELPPRDIAGLRVGPPVARPTAVICIGQNYAAHAAESDASPPADPIIFFKHPNTVVGPYDPILLPRQADKLDWEVELGVVMGRRCRYLESDEQARSNVAGFCISHDVSERGFQLERSGGQWSKGKSCEAFNPLGPWLVPADEIEPQALGLRSYVNGEPRQKSTTADMIFPVAALVRHLSNFMVLEPGDLINTGTPQGVALSGRFPYLVVGDVVTLEIDGLGRQEQVVQ